MGLQAELPRRPERSTTGVGVLTTSHKRRATTSSSVLPQTKPPPPPSSSQGTDTSLDVPWLVPREQEDR